MTDRYPVIEFHQYGSSDPDDRLLMFAAPATSLWGWAGVPRKGWKIRMLYQRWINESRKQEVKQFWDQASTPRDNQAKKYLVGPTAITLAIVDDIDVSSGNISLEYHPPFDMGDSTSIKLSKAAEVVISRMRSRLTSDEFDILSDSSRWFDGTVEHNYVLESLIQIQQASADPDKFISHNDLDNAEALSLVSSLESLCRPALIVDGQHRLYGAAHSNSETILLPVVAIPNSPWMEQIYQFVVINEKAKKVESSLLTDIFGSSLTPSEQAEIRSQLSSSGAQVDPRIAAVIAGRDTESPFYNMVRIRLEGDPVNGSPGFIPEATIRQLIEGGRGGLGWRSDNEFYEAFVAPTFPNRAEWDSWSNGKWREFWFAFWDEVRDWYNAISDSLLWSNEQSNLTKAVTLRMYQKLFMEMAISRIDGAAASRETLVEVLGEEVAEQRLSENLRKLALPMDVANFRTLVRDWFLKDGVPVRVFTYNWVSSLDDQTGQEALYEEFVDAWKLTRDPTKTYRARNSKIFTTEDK